MNLTEVEEGRSKVQGQPQQTKASLCYGIFGLKTIFIQESKGRAGERSSLSGHLHQHHISACRHYSEKTDTGQFKVENKFVSIKRSLTGYSEATVCHRFLEKTRHSAMESGPAPYSTVASRSPEKNCSGP